MTDPYSVLGISPGADDETIKKAYRQKCKQYHPDLHPNDPSAEEKFKEVQAAYSEIMRRKQGGGQSGYQQRSASGGSYGYGSQNQYGGASAPSGLVSTVPPAAAARPIPPARKAPRCAPLRITSATAIIRRH